ncbi:MAG: glycerol-3-phosphate 1-O-acyltransferase PlsY [Planctomycetaceae bacterium]|nr:glycerol-3-phosphate 1-O-acyltransferase PlsY [Planctomycetaceae bacterium]
MMPYLLFIIGAYLLGSVPFGLLIARAHGKDLRAIGSGNIGATNVARALGRKWAIVCFVLDVLKGLTPMVLVPLFRLADKDSGPGALGLWMVVGCAAVIGHIFPLYLRFKGGKGVATSLGVLLGLWPYFTLCGAAAFIVWGVCVLIWRYVSLASIIAAAAFPCFLAVAITLIDQWTFEQLWLLQTAASLMSLLVILRHRENIKRLLHGTESKVGQKKPAVA